MNDEQLLWNMSGCLMWDKPEYTKNERSAFFKNSFLSITYSGSVRIRSMLT